MQHRIRNKLTGIISFVLLFITFSCSNSLTVVGTPWPKPVKDEQQGFTAEESFTPADDNKNPVSDPPISEAEDITNLVEDFFAENNTWQGKVDDPEMNDEGCFDYDLELDVETQEASITFYGEESEEPPCAVIDGVYEMDEKGEIKVVNEGLVVSVNADLESETVEIEIEVIPSRPITDDTTGPDDELITESYDETTWGFHGVNVLEDLDDRTHVDEVDDLAAKAPPPSMAGGLLVPTNNPPTKKPKTDKMLPGIFTSENKK